MYRKCYGDRLPISLLDDIFTSLDNFKTKDCVNIIQSLFPIQDYTGKFLLSCKGARIGKPDKYESAIKFRKGTYTFPVYVDLSLSFEGEEISRQEILFVDIPNVTPSGSLILRGTEWAVISHMEPFQGFRMGTKFIRMTSKGRWITASKEKISFGYSPQVPTSIIRELHLYKEKNLAATPEFKSIWKGVTGLDDYNKDDTQGHLEFIENFWELLPLESHIAQRIKTILKLAEPPKNLTMDIIDNLIEFTQSPDRMEEFHYLLDRDSLSNKRIITIRDIYSNLLQRCVNESIRTIKNRMKSRRNIDEIIKSSLTTKLLWRKLLDSEYKQYLDQTNFLSDITNKSRIVVNAFASVDVHPSFYGRICPIETPEGLNIGKLITKAAFAKTDEHGFLTTPVIDIKTGEIKDITVYDEFNKHIAYKSANLKDKEVIVRYNGANKKVAASKVDYQYQLQSQFASYSSHLIPFMQNNDANRSLMACNMQRQALPLVDKESPFVCTGYGADAKANFGSILAKQDGKVISIDKDKLIVKYKDDEEDTEIAINSYRPSNQKSLVHDNILFRPNDSFSKGDILADSSSTIEGEYGVGKNLRVAFMPWRGFNFEDAIVVSERVVTEGLLDSISIHKYECELQPTERISKDLLVDADKTPHLTKVGLPRIGSQVSSGDILIGKLSEREKSKITISLEDGLLEKIFNVDPSQFIDSPILVGPTDSGLVDRVTLFNKEGKMMEINEANQESDIVIRRFQPVIVRVYIRRLDKISVGDKLSGRHGNKGVVGKIVPHTEMPTDEHGNGVDIILNPLGIPSRMNVGQLMESYLGGISLSVAEKLKSLKSSDEGEFNEYLSLVHKYMTGEKLAVKDRDKYYKIYSKGLLFGVSPFKQIDLKEINKDLEADYVDSIWLTDGVEGERFQHKVNVGSMYILKLNHNAIDKLAARSTGGYNRLTAQPVGGKSRRGGQRIGEMDVWALLVHNAHKNLRECLTLKSDDVRGRKEFYQGLVEGKTEGFNHYLPMSADVFFRELYCLGIGVKSKHIKNIIKKL